MILLFANDAYTTISGSITNISTTVNLASGSGALFPTPVPGSSYFKATFRDAATGLLNEIVHVTNRVGDVLTIVRAQESTTAQNWNAGDSLDNLITAGSLAAMEQSGSLINTSVIYSGIDTSGTPNQINVSSTTPPWVGSLIEDSTFRIRIANTNLGDSFISINGGANKHIVGPDGSNLNQGDLHIGQEAYFTIDNSLRAQLLSTATHYVPIIPQTDYYVATTGNDSTGDGLTSGTAWRTVEHARLTLQGFATNVPVTIHVAAGTYVVPAHTIGANFVNSTVGQWIIQGAGQTTTIFDATATGARGIVSFGDTVTVNNVGVNSYYEAFVAQSGGRITLNNCNASSTAAGSFPLIGAYYSGTIFIFGDMTVSGSISSWIGPTTGGSVEVGYQDANVTIVTDITFDTTTTLAVVLPQSSGSVLFYSAVVNWHGATPTGLKFNCTTGGGITTFGAGVNYIPGTVAGTTNSGSDNHGWYT